MIIKEINLINLNISIISFENQEKKVRNFIYQNTNTQSGTGGIKMQKN